MDDLRKRLNKTEERLNYLIRVKDSSTWGNLSGFQEKYNHLKFRNWKRLSHSLKSAVRKTSVPLSGSASSEARYVSPSKISWKTSMKTSPS
jgi:hypothetical protein